MQIPQTEVSAAEKAAPTKVGSDNFRGQRARRNQKKLTMLLTSPYLQSSTKD
jgi:hypothetical protein